MSRVLKMRWVSFGLILLLTTVTFALPACTSAATQAVPVTPTITTAEPVGDEEIRSNIIDRLSVDTSVDATNLTVDVNNGNVVLGGTVPSLQQAITILGIVNSLPHTTITDNLVVQPTEGGDDEDIREHLVVLFDLADDIDTSNVNISVNSGVVTLSGSVDHLWQKEKLEEIALSEASVVSIENNINVIVITSVPDQEILDAVNRVIRILSAEITAQVENGVVTLSGFVSCCNEEELLGIVSGINGVIQIINNSTWDDPENENIC